jgi:hypothetical protein
MIKIRWWVLLVYSVVLAAGAWKVSRLYVKPIPWWIHSGGPAAPDPFEHVLTITGAFDGSCDEGCAGPTPPGLAKVTWHLSTTAPAGGLPDPLPELEGEICQTGTWATPAESCTIAFEIKVGEQNSVSPGYLFAFVQPPPSSAAPGTISAIYLELRVGAKRTSPTQKPAMEARAQAEFLVLQPLGPYP